MSRYLKDCLIGLSSLVASVLATVPAAAETHQCQAASPSEPVTYTLTLYVENAFPNGHVFIGLCDGENQEKWGWYTQYVDIRRAGGLAGCSGGQLRKDDLAEYDVWKSYVIDKHGYYTIKSKIIGREAAGEGATAKWNPFNHCGDFALDAAALAGIKLDLPAAFPRSDTPRPFGAYLLAHGGHKHVRIGAHSSNLSGHWSSKFGDVELRYCPDTALTGYWDQPQHGRGTITDGTFDPSTMQAHFSYSQPWNGAHGTADFVLSDSGIIQTLRGTWNQTDQSGKASSGHWVLTRFMPNKPRSGGSIGSGTIH
jgi:hypothetical protein